MQNSEVEYKKTKSEPLAARPASTAVLWGCVGGRLTVCQSICPSVRSSPLARAVRGWTTMAKAHTMSHSVRNAAPTCERAQTQRGEAARRTKRASLPLLSRLCQCTAPRASVPTSSGLHGSAEKRIAPFSTPLRYNGNTQESPTIQWTAGINIPKTPKCILFSPRNFKVNVPWRFRASSDTPPYLISQTSTGHPGTNARTGGEPDWTSADSVGGSARLRQWENDSTTPRHNNIDHAQSAVFKSKA